METVSRLLAEEFTKAEAQVTVVTHTTGPDPEAEYKVIRRPSKLELRSLAATSDVILQNMISLRTLLPLVLSGKPIVITHHSWMRRSDGTRGIENLLKLLAVRAGHNVAISRSIAESLPVKANIIKNPFETNEFSIYRDEPRDRDIVFMGRLVSDKGCDLLVRSVAQLRSIGVVATLSIIGDGPEMPSLRDLVSALGIASQVTFWGTLRAGRGRVVGRHKVMAIPSIWAEPFGLVALEGIAAGCVIVASSQGGLMEAVGPCGLFFQNGNVDALTAALNSALTDLQLRQHLALGGPKHLEEFEPARAAKRYLDLFRSIAKNG